MPDFDPYYEWLGIPPKDQPAHHYRLLGVELFEEHRSAIDAAANRLMAYLQELSNGEDATLAQKLLNEVAAARVCLLNAKQKASYDHKLKAILQKQSRKTADSALPVATPLREKAVPTPPPVATAQIIADSDAAPLISTEEGQDAAPTAPTAPTAPAETSRRTRRSKNNEIKVLFVVIGLLVVAAGTLVFFYANKPAEETSPPGKKNNTTSRSKGTSTEPLPVTEETIPTQASEFARRQAHDAEESKANIEDICEIAHFLVSPYGQQLAEREIAEQKKFYQFVADKAFQLFKDGFTLTNHQLDFRALPRNFKNRPQPGADITEIQQYDKMVREEGGQNYRKKYTQEFDQEAKRRLGVQEN